MFPITNGISNSFTTLYDSTYLVSCNAGRWLPIPNPTPKSLAADARFELIFFAFEYPPVIAEIIIGAFSFFLKIVVPRSISDLASSGKD